VHAAAGGHLYSGRAGGVKGPRARQGTKEQIATSGWLCYPVTAMPCNCIADVLARLHLPI